MLCEGMQTRHVYNVDVYDYVDSSDFMRHIVLCSSFQLRQLCQHIAKPLMRVRNTVYYTLKQLDINLATPTHRGTAGGCRRFNNAIPVRVATAINYIIRTSAQYIVNKNNLIYFFQSYQ